MAFFPLFPWQSSPKILYELTHFSWRVEMESWQIVTAHSNTSCLLKQISRKCSNRYSGVNQTTFWRIQNVKHRSSKFKNFLWPGRRGRTSLKETFKRQKQLRGARSACSYLKSNCFEARKAYSNCNTETSSISFWLFNRRIEFRKDDLRDFLFIQFSFMDYVLRVLWGS